VSVVLKRSDPRYHSAGAKAALQKELLRLEAVETWYAEPYLTGEARKIPGAQHSRLHGIRGLKHSELGPEAQDKARVVVLGNNVVDNFGDATFFADVSSTPTSMSAVRSLISYGLLSAADEAGGSSTSDAEAAFVQPLLPEDVWIFVVIIEELLTPKMVATLKRLGLSSKQVTWRLRRPLYGLACAGWYWEKYLDSKLQSIGFSSVPNWPQTWVRPTPRGVQAVTSYVDDMVAAGPGHRDLWKEVQRHIKCSDPLPIDRLLGVNHRMVVETSSSPSSSSSSTNNAALRGTHNSSSSPSSPSKAATCYFEMTAFAEQTVAAFQKEGGLLPSRIPASPWLELTAEELNKPALTGPGRYAAKAASFLMKALWLARCQRPDILFTIAALARDIHSWKVSSDRRLERLYGYVAATTSMVLRGDVQQGGQSDVELHVFVDSDWGGCEKTARSTSGIWVELQSADGTKSFPIDFASARQTAVSHSSTEAEVVAMSKAMREKALPLEELWEALLARKVRATFHEDNSACILAVAKGYSQQLRHLAKHQRIGLGLCHEVAQERPVLQVESAKQKGDFLTKGLGGPAHSAALELVALGPPSSS